MIIEFTKVDGSKVYRVDCIKAEMRNYNSGYIDTFRVVFENNVSYCDYKFINVIYDNKSIFKGIVDSQKILYNNSGKFLTVECRSIIGLLIDKYIRPQNLYRITDNIIYQKYLKPLNININKITNKPCLSVINTGKNMNLYELISEYSSKVFHCEPKITAEGIVVLNGETEETYYNFSDRSSNVKDSFICKEIQLENKRKDIISKIYIRNKENEIGYGLVLENKNALKRGIDSERYIDIAPPSKSCIYDGMKMINTSEKNSLKIKIFCSSFINKSTMCVANVIVDGEVFKNMEVQSAFTIFDKDGVSTVLEMSRKESKFI